MKLTRERKIFGAVLLLGLGVLGYDQLGLTPEAGTEATADALLVASAPTQGGPQANIQHGMKDETSLAERLATLASATIPASSGNAIGEGRDIFRPAGSWLASGTGTGDVRIDAMKFAQLHKLSTVSVSGPNGGVAVVDGKLLHVGATLDGFKLSAIDRQGARFRAADGSEARLNLTAQVAQGQ